MIKIILFVLFFLITVAVVPYLIGEKGYILIAMGDFTIESSVVTATIMLTLLFIGLLLLIKVMRGSMKFSLGAWNKVVFAGKRRGQRELNKGVAAYLLGDFKQAEHLLAKSAEPSQQPQIAYLMAANAAQAQGLSANTDHYLQLAAHQEQSLKDLGIENVLVKIKLLLNRNELEKARSLVDEHHRHIGHDVRLLMLVIDLCIAEQHFEQAVEHLDQARKQKSITDEQIQTWENIIFKARFTDIIKQQSNDALLDYWRSLSKKVKQRETVLVVYCQVLAEQDVIEPLNKLLLPIIKKGTNATLIAALKKLPIKQPHAFIIAIEKHLHKNPDDLLWLSCLGHFAYSDNNVILAEKAFKTLQQKLVTPMEESDLKTYANVLINQEKHQEAAQLLLSHHEACA